MARGEGVQLLIYGVGGYAIWQMGLAGTLGEDVQKAFLSIKASLSGDTPPPGTKPPPGTTPPAAGGCPFISGRRYIYADYNTTNPMGVEYVVVWAGQAVWRATDQGEAERYYNRLVSEKGCASGA